ncbi:hypothetical protein Tco_0320441 [Tanacetum coccineum]
MPEQMLVGEFLPPYFISQLEDSIIISGSFNFGNFRIIYAWELEVDDGEVSLYRQLFIIPYPAEHELKLIGFSKDKQPIVEAAIFQQWHQSLQVFNPSIQSFQNVGVEANHGAILWNPSIRKFSGIEVPYMANRPRINKIVWGFGVRPDTLDPTIVNISMSFYGDGLWHVLLYTLNSDTWRVLGNARLPRIIIRIKQSWGVAVAVAVLRISGQDDTYRVCKFAHLNSAKDLCDAKGSPFHTQQGRFLPHTIPIARNFSRSSVPIGIASTCHGSSTDKSKITRKQSKASKRGHENQKSTKPKPQKTKALANFHLQGPILQFLKVLYNLKERKERDGPFVSDNSDCKYLLRDARQISLIESNINAWLYVNSEKGFRGTKTFIAAMLPVVDQSAGPADQAEDQPSSSEPLPSTSHPTPVPEPTTHPTSPSPEPDNEPTEHTFDQPSTEHQPLTTRQNPGQALYNLSHPVESCAYHSYTPLTMM